MMGMQIREIKEHIPSRLNSLPFKIRGSVLYGSFARGTSTQDSDIDILFGAKGVSLAALYSPEHGIRGEFTAGESVGSATDPHTGLHTGRSALQRGYRLSRAVSFRRYIVDMQG